MATDSQNSFYQLNIAILTASDTRSLAEDSSGDYLQSSLESAGHQCFERVLVKDDKYQLRAKVSTWIAEPQVNVIITTGGTGFTSRDSTPEALAPLFDKQVDGFGELFRYFSLAEIGTSTIQSRAVAGMANNTLIICLPGSTGACKTAWSKIIEPQLNATTKPCNFVTHLTTNN
jgi:molybdopterin adenylyltransferase